MGHEGPMEQRRRFSTNCQGEASAEVRGELQRICLEFPEMDPLHRAGIPRLYLLQFHEFYLSQINDKISSQPCTNMSLPLLASHV